MALTDLLRPRLTAGAVAFLAVPLALTALGTATLAGIALALVPATRRYLVAGQKSLEQGILLKAEMDQRLAAFEQLMTQVRDDLGLTAGAASKWASAIRKANEAPPAPAVPLAADSLTPNLDRQIAEHETNGASGLLRNRPDGTGPHP
jgi:hypothetical protein